MRQANSSSSAEPREVRFRRDSLFGHPGPFGQHCGRPARARWQLRQPRGADLLGATDDQYRPARCGPDRQVHHAARCSLTGCSQGNATRRCRGSRHSGVSIRRRGCSSHGRPFRRRPRFDIRRRRAGKRAWLHAAGAIDCGRDLARVELHAAPCWRDSPAGDGAGKWLRPEPAARSRVGGRVRRRAGGRVAPRVGGGSRSGPRIGGGTGRFGAIRPRSSR